MPCTPPVCSDLPWWSLIGIVPYAVVKNKVEEIKNKRSNTPDLRNIKEENRTYEICLRAVTHDGYQYRYVPTKFQTNLDIITAVLKGNEYSAINDIPWEYKTVHYIKQLIDINPRCVWYIHVQSNGDRSLTTQEMEKAKEELFYYALSKDVSVLNALEGNKLRAPMHEELYQAIVKCEGWREKLCSKLVCEVDMYELRRSIPPLEVIVEI